jgi:hypothetical protein
VKALRWLPYTLVLSLVPSLASADEASLVARVKNQVETKVVAPLAQMEGSRFSRGRPPPRERRVRVTQATAALDKSGKSFVPFAVDVRFGGKWNENDIVGCAYQGSGDLFVKRGDAYRPASFLLGKKADPVPGVCEAASDARS